MARPRKVPSTADAPARPSPNGGRRFGPETIAEAVGALEAGVPAPVVCRRFGVSDRTLYRWRRRVRG